MIDEDAQMAGDGADVLRAVDARLECESRGLLVPEDSGSLAEALPHRDLADTILGRSLLPEHEVPSASDVASLSAVVARLLRVRGRVEADDVGATLAALGRVRSRVNALEALEAVLLERLRVQSLRAQGLLEESEPMVSQAPSGRLADLARRTVAAEAAQELRQTESAVSRRMNEAQALVARAPLTLAGAVAGAVGWRNAAKVADVVAELDDATAARLDTGVADAAARQNPARFASTLRRVRDRVHATPAEVRHQEAATKRGVWTEPAADGMAYLTLFAPAPAVHAIADRLTTVGAAARADGDSRTLAQLRADTVVALLLDDGTLDLESAATTAAALATGAAPAAPRALDAPAGSAASAGPGFASTPRARGSDDDLLAAVADDQRHEPDVPVTADPGRPYGFRFSLATLARSVRPKIYLSVPVLTLLGRSDAPALLDGMVPVDPETARELAGLSTSFTRILTHPETGQVLSVGSQSYRPPADLRSYLKVRDATCRFPGCNRRAAETDGDHTVARADGGRTVASNLALLCRRHHVLKHQARFAVAQSPSGDGTLTWTTPTGRTRTTHPAAVTTTLHDTVPRFSPMGPDPDDDPPQDLGDPPF